MNLMNQPNSVYAPTHGGDLSEATRIFGDPSQGWLDLSTGINLGAYPNVEVSGPFYHNLPEREQTQNLLSVAGHYYGVPKELAIVAGAGSQAFLQCLPGLVPHQRVAVIGPTYAEHAKTWKNNGHQVSMVKDIAEIAGATGGAADVIVIVNPNNPDGRTVPPKRLLDLAHSQIGGDGLLVVDEAFADVDPAISLIPYLRDEPVVVLRSFGKFFGLAGLRLGFAVACPPLVDRIGKKLGPWAVSGPAVEIGTRAMADRAWIKTTRIELLERRKKLDGVLLAAGLEIAGGTNLFRLVHDDQAQNIFLRLGRAGIYVRKFPEHPSWLRFGVPGTEAEFSRLEKAL